MKPAIAVLMLCAALAFCGTVRAQQTPAFALYGGYSYLNVDTNRLTSRLNTNGWEAAFTGNVNRYAAFEGDVSGYYKTELIPIHDYSVAGGVRLNLRPVFVHGLIGLDSLGARGVTQNGLAFIIGGGVEQRIAPRVAIRVSADYVSTEHNIFGGVGVTQNNFRASAGIVFTFGGRDRGFSRPASKLPRPAASPAQAPIVESEMSVLGAAGYGTDKGFVITGVDAGSRAAGINLKAGDVITKVDGRDVHSRRDVDAAIAMSVSGTIKLDCLIPTYSTGMVAVERTVQMR